jgi:chromosome segregation ATPase
MAGQQIDNTPNLENPYQQLRGKTPSWMDVDNENEKDVKIVERDCILFIDKNSARSLRGELEKEETKKKEDAKNLTEQAITEMKEDANLAIKMVTSLLDQTEENKVRKDINDAIKQLQKVLSSYNKKMDKVKTLLKEAEMQTKKKRSTMEMITGRLSHVLGSSSKVDVSSLEVRGKMFNIGTGYNTDVKVVSVFPNPHQIEVSLPDGKKKSVKYTDMCVIPDFDKGKYRYNIKQYKQPKQK